MQDTKEELLKTKTTIDTEKTLQDETKMLVRAKTHTETLLTTQATHLQSSLKGAVDDISGMYIYMYSK